MRGIFKTERNLRIKKKEQYLYDKDYKYPDTKLEFHSRENELNSKHKIHPTQKPIALLEYLIKTYTNKNELILDFTMGSGSTMVACQNTNRNGIGIELDEHYFAVAKKRVEENKKELDAPTLFNSTN